MSHTGPVRPGTFWHWPETAWKARTKINPSSAFFTSRFAFAHHDISGDRPRRRHHTRGDADVQEMPSAGRGGGFERPEKGSDPSRTSRLQSLKVRQSWGPAVSHGRNMQTHGESWPRVFLPPKPLHRLWFAEGATWHFKGGSDSTCGNHRVSTSSNF